MQLEIGLAADILAAVIQLFVSQSESWKFSLSSCSLLASVSLSKTLNPEFPYDGKASA